MVLDDAATRRQARHEATRREILDAAWALAERDGVAALSFREVAAKVGMRAPSLYTYFDSKDDLYDAMFVDGNRQAIALLDEFEGRMDPGWDAHELITRGTIEFLKFCQDSVARYQLLYTRSIPGWSPSTDAFAVAVEYFERSMDYVRMAGIDTDDALDVYTAVFSGLAAQQMANDPTGDRWIRIVPSVVRMLLDAAEKGTIR